MATKTTTIRLPQEVRDRMDRYLTRSRLSLNRVVAAAITEYLDRHEKPAASRNGRLLQLEDVEKHRALLEEILRKEERDE
jgi:predicted transcriptional regulator